MKRETLSAVQTAKADLRRTMRTRLRAISPAAHAEASLIICQAAARLPAFARARCVALFIPLPSEPDVRLLIEEAWADKKRVVLPLMIPGTVPKLDWHEVADWEDLVVQGPFGLQEPDPLNCERIRPEEIECVFAPGLAFDDQGYRLGRGGGFYDVYLSQAPAEMSRIGIMFTCQRVAEVPREGHDQALASVLTEDGVRLF